MLENILLLVIGLVVLIVGGELLVRGASKLALKMKITPFVVGLTVVAFGTSAPELFISVQSALEGSSSIALGNVVGSNICNLALVLGVTGIITKVSVSKSSLKFDWPVMMLAALLLYFFAATSLEISRLEGGIFLLCLILFLVFTFRNAKISGHVDLEETSPEEALVSDSMPKSFFFILIGLVGLYFGSEWFVKAAREIALNFGISERVIGVTVVALGTSLPELVTAIISALKKETDLALGNLLGSNIFNVFAILGVTVLIKPIEVDQQIVSMDMLWMLGVSLLVFVFMITGKKVSRVESMLLLAVYALYIYNVLI